ncbi:hypothetical protein D3C73_1480750 [compost metagenome]
MYFATSASSRDSQSESVLRSLIAWPQAPKVSFDNSGLGTSEPLSAFSIFRITWPPRPAMPGRKFEFQTASAS